MGNRFCILWVLSGLLLVLASCLGTAPTTEVRKVDALNSCAYEWCYKNLDSACWYVGAAANEVRFYTDGKAEALNTLGFCRYMQMDFERAEACYRQVATVTQNDLERLIADVGLMRIYQRTAKNKLFYDYRNSALKRMGRIGEDRNLFTESRELRRLDYAFSEFYIVSAFYYFSLQQEKEAWNALDEVAEGRWVENDSAQYLYYQYACGLMGKGSGQAEGDDAVLKRLDGLYRTWRMARDKGYAYLEAVCSLELAGLLLSDRNREVMERRRSHSLSVLMQEVGQILPRGLAEHSLTSFDAYGAPFLKTASYAVTAKCMNYSGEYTQALDLLKKALALVNAHHRYYHVRGMDTDSLVVYKPENESPCLEMDWLRNSAVNTVPEWILRIREQLSVSFAGLGSKKASDYNRNIYLDVLSEIRQDKELENRYERLANREAELDVLIVALLAGLVLVLICLVLLDRYSKKKNKLYTERLEQTLALCREIILHLPVDAGAVQQGLDCLFGAGKVEVARMPDSDKWQLRPVQRLSKEETALVRLVQPYLDWASDSESLASSLQEEYVRLEKEKYVHEQHILVNKRQNIVKKACLSIVNGIQPYLDRMLNEVHKLTQKGFVHDEAIKQEKYAYIDELAARINEYNEILALWVKMKQGAIALNIESFALEELFQLVAKGHRGFEQKGLALEVSDADVYVKADRALTLFMLSTLVDNARKYTPAGGTVKLLAVECADYVEISVEDDGVGLSQEDVHRILSEKVYDPQEIGTVDGVCPEEVRANKGSGFGLMNCKGIIEKYRKTSALFQVCVFGIQSKPGCGSRFYFRLPKGMRRVLAMLAAVGLLPFVTGCSGKDASGIEEEMLRMEQATRYDADFEPMLKVASDYADEVYYANLRGDYEMAVAYADSALAVLNAHYWRYAVMPGDSIRLYGPAKPAELDWWNAYFDTDYHVILDVRNEAAVAFLALCRWDAYEYNNRAYTSLYKLHSEDRTLDVYCKQLQHSTTAKVVGIVLCCLIGVILLAGYYWLYVRKRTLDRLRLEQLFDVNRAIFDATGTSGMERQEEALQYEENTLKLLPKRIVQEIFRPLNELIPVRELGLSVFYEAAGRLEYASRSGEDCPTDAVGQCFDRSEWIYEDGRVHVPLLVESGGTVQKVGVLTLGVEEPLSRQECLLLELLERYIAVVVLNSVVKTAGRYRDIESAHEEAHKAMWEDNQIHVQNMVLDNCLSAIKHETVYYPNRIRQIIGKLRTGEWEEQEELRQISAMTELVEYYKGVFSVLSSCASRQLDEVLFRRGTVQVQELLDYARVYGEKYARKHGLSIEFRILPAEGTVIGDRILLRLLVESLVHEAVSVRRDGVISLEARPDGRFFEFRFTDWRRSVTEDELRNLFYPNLALIQAEERGEGNGTSLLLCKQIIREHDEYAGRRGCRMEGERTEDSFTILFTVPSR